MGKTFIVGDIHGAHKALVQCIERSGFDKEKDTLIQLGDVVDGWGDTFECVEELLTIPNLFKIKGNHDDEFLHWLTWGFHKWHWQQGAVATAKSYIKHADREILFMPSNGGYKTNLTTVDIPKAHLQFFREQIPYLIHDEPYRCFVHGGFNRHLEFKGQHPERIYWWDRDLWAAALTHKSVTNPLKKDGYKFHMKTPFEEVFIGHTATVNWDTDQPMNAANVWNLDTGAGFKGKLTIMNVDTKEYWQSDRVEILYPNEIGRT